MFEYLRLFLVFNLAFFDSDQQKKTFGLVKNIS